MLKDHPFSAVRDQLFNTFAVTFHTWNVADLLATSKNKYHAEGPSLVSCSSIQYIYSYFLHLGRVLFRREASCYNGK
jgi:hypothetical protein